MIADADKAAADDIFLAAIKQTERNDGWLLEILARHRELGRIEGARMGLEAAAQCALCNGVGVRWYEQIIADEILSLNAEAISEGKL